MVRIRREETAKMWGQRAKHLKLALWVFSVLFCLMIASPSKCESYRSTDPFAGAITQLDNDDYTSDNPFEKPCTEAKVSRPPLSSLFHFLKYVTLTRTAELRVI